MTRRLDIGVCAYRDIEKLRACLIAIAQNTVSEWRCFIIHNPSEGDELIREFICGRAERDPRFVPVWLPENVRYCGAVNKLLSLVETDYFAYFDDDAEVKTPGWDEMFCATMEAHPEIAQMYPGSGHYGFFNGQYHECLWCAGYCWMMRRSALKVLYESDRKHRRCPDLGMLDTTLGHHTEVDLMIRLRLAGFQIGCEPKVNVVHHETGTKADAADHKPGGIIHDGVVRFMNKWNGYFLGDAVKYSMTAYDERALRYSDWLPCALYLERWTLAQFPNINVNPITLTTSAGPMDAIEVLKPKGCYVGRAI